MEHLLLCLFISVLLNIFVFFFAYRNQTDHLTDITYSITFLTLAVFCIWRADKVGVDKYLLVTMVFLWAIRLGAYLFVRIRRMGSDSRFDEMRPVWSRYIKFWMLQAVSVWLVALPYLHALVSSTEFENLHLLHWVGLIIWLSGWLIESLADYQKNKFKADPTNKGKFIKEGLYRLVQYPNYLGEMMVWIGICIFCFPYFTGWQWLSVISPLWIITLLLFISGIPFLESSRKETYGHLEAYQDYIGRTKKVFPFVY